MADACDNGESTDRSATLPTSDPALPLGTSAGRRAKSATRADGKGERTRSRIVTAARTVFERDGYLNARIRDIVAEAELGHGSFYTYFQSKQEVFQEIVREVGDQLRAVITRPPDNGPEDPRLSVDRANRRYLTFYRENARLLTAVEEAATVDSVIHDFRAERRQHHIRRVTASIERLQECGLADPAVDAHHTAVALVAMLSTFAFWCAKIPEDYDEERTAQTINNIWAQAIGLTQTRPSFPFPKI